MAVSQPFRRNCRQFINGKYSEGGSWHYILHPKYAQSPEQYIRAFLLILKDLQTLFDYVEPADANLCCYSYRIHEILLRACIEVEANCKAILIENGYSKSGNMNIKDYERINPTHHLSSYEVRLPLWNGNKHTRKPFSNWASNNPLPWYKAYNDTKHNRQKKFANATFDHMLDSVCGLLVIISAQFYNHDFSPNDWSLSIGGSNDGMESSIGEYFRIKFPDDWSTTEQYDFDWQSLKTNHVDPFAKINYT